MLGDEILFGTDARSQKARNLACDDRIVLSIEDVERNERGYQRHLIVRGNVVHSHPGPDPVLMDQLALKYLDSEPHPLAVRYLPLHRRGSCRNRADQRRRPFSDRHRASCRPVKRSGKPGWFPGLEAEDMSACRASVLARDSQWSVGCTGDDVRETLTGGRPHLPLQHLVQSGLVVDQVEGSVVTSSPGLDREPHALSVVRDDGAHLDDTGLHVAFERGKPESERRDVDDLTAPFHGPASWIT